MAVTLTVEALAAAVGFSAGADTKPAGRVLPVATALVEDYAPAAPEAVQNEAVIRFAGYLLNADYGTVRSQSLGPQSLEFVTNHAAMFRNSGAAALLTRYKRRRAGAI